MERAFLAIDASTYTGSAAIVRPGAVVGECSVAMRGEREERLMPAIASLMEGAGMGRADCAGVICGAGPGSFTSLRIAASIAKGLATAFGAPLFAVPSPVLVVAGAEPQLPPGSYRVLIDAMRDESYEAMVSVSADGSIGAEPGFSIIRTADAVTRAAGTGAVLVGPAIGSGLLPHAKGAARLLSATRTGALLTGVDIDSWEPDYGRRAEAQVRWEAAHGRTLRPE